MFFFYCCQVKTFSYGFRKAGPLCETHCKPRNGAAVGWYERKARFPGGGLMPLVVSRVCKSRFAEQLLVHICTHSCAALRLAVGFA